MKPEQIKWIKEKLYKEDTILELNYLKSKLDESKNTSQESSKKENKK